MKTKGIPILALTLLLFGILSAACGLDDKTELHKCRDGEMVALASSCNTDETSAEADHVCSDTGERVQFASDCKKVTCRDGNVVALASECKSPAPQPTAPPEPATEPEPSPPPHTCDIADIGGTDKWEARGIAWKPKGSFNLKGHPDWTIHTPAYDGSTPGLPPGVEEWITAPHATAYCDPYKGDQAVSNSAPASESTSAAISAPRTDCVAMRGTPYQHPDERGYYKSVCEPMFAAIEQQAAAAARASAPAASSYVAPQSLAYSASAAPAAPAPACGDPSAMGGSWTKADQYKWSLNGTATITGHAAWTVHTNAHPGDPGLPIGAVETTVGASAYCKPNAAGYAQAPTPSYHPEPAQNTAPPAMVEGCNPDTELGGSWHKEGEGWRPNGTITFTGAPGWIIHVHPYGTAGLPVGKTVTTDDATAYCEKG